MNNKMYCVSCGTYLGTHKQLKVSKASSYMCPKCVETKNYPIVFKDRIGRAWK